MTRATFTQTQVYLKPLLRKLKNKSLSEDISDSLGEITKHLLNRNYIMVIITIFYYPWSKWSNFIQIIIRNQTSYINFTGKWSLSANGYRKRTMANRRHYGWYPCENRERENLFKKCCSCYERRNSEKIHSGT